MTDGGLIARQMHVCAVSRRLDGMPMDRTLIEKALSAAGFAVLVLDDDDRLVETSVTAARLLGFDPFELIGQSVSAFLPIASIKSLVIEPAPTGLPGVVIEIAARNRSEREVPLVASAVRWTEPCGRNLTSVFLRDMALEREVARIAQNHLVQSDNAIRGANIGVFEYDLTTQSVTVSDIWRTLLDLLPSDAVDVQEEWRSRVHPDDLAAALDPIHRCAHGDVERASCEYRLLSRDRSAWRWMRTDVSVARRDLDGNPLLLVGAQTDISGQKNTEEALRISEARFRSAFEDAPIGKALVGLDGSWLLVNPALLESFGYAEEELHSTNFQSLTHPDDLKTDLDLLKALVEGKIPSYTMEKRYVRANGAIMWGRLSVGLVRDAEGRPNHFVTQIVDITEQRRLDQLKNEFVSVVSHELRTPLTSILGALSLLELDDDAQFSDATQRLLFIAKTNGERMNSLINDMLDFQKFSAKQMRFSLAPHPVAGLVDDAILANLALTDRYAVRLETRITDRSLVAMVDPKRLQQVMTNLLSNAAKFAEPGSAVEVSADLVDANIRVAVTNVGEGITADFRDRVFVPFSQASSVSDRKSGGTGLGLSITKQIVEQMGGQIGFESVPGSKTTFWFTLRTIHDPEPGV
jgi:PAS domain S-box-containing protein